MKGRFQLLVLVLVTIVVTALLIAWATGFIVLSDEKEGDVLIEHQWRAANAGEEPQFHNVSLPLKVPSGTGRIRLSYNVELPSDLVVGLPGSLEDPSPEVMLELVDGAGTIVWSDVFYTSARSTADINVTAAGGWALHVWAKGYGYEGQTGLGTPVEFHDSIKVTISTA